MINKSHTCLGVADSSLTGAAWFVGDFGAIHISIETSGTTASRFTIIGSDEDGFQSALGTPSQTGPSDGWYVVAVPVNAGGYSFTSLDGSGTRWLNAFRVLGPSASSATIIFTGRLAP